METSQRIAVVITASDAVDCVDEACLICLQSLVVGDAERAPYGEWVCAHHPLFHPGCIQRWLESSSVCPVCRGEVTVSNEEEGRDRRARGEQRRRHPRRQDGTREAFIEGQRQCSHGILFTVSALLTSIYAFYGDIYIAASCLVTWSFVVLVVLNERAQSCHYLCSLSVLFSFHIWRCHSILQLCTGPKAPICENFMTIIYSHVVAVIYAFIFVISSYMRPTVVRYEAMLLDDDQTV